MFKTSVTERLGIRYPLIGGTVMHIADANSVAAISEAGGRGILASAIDRNKQEFGTALALTALLVAWACGNQRETEPGGHSFDDASASAMDGTTRLEAGPGLSETGGAVLDSPPQPPVVGDTALDAAPTRLPEGGEHSDAAQDAAPPGQLEGGDSQSGPAPVVAALNELDECPTVLPVLFSRSAINPPASGSGIYYGAEAPLRQELDRSIRAMLAVEVAEALDAAERAGYMICRAGEDSSPVVVWRPQVNGQGHAVLAWRAIQARPLIVEAPHAFHDVDTEIQALEMFMGLNARALILSGILRCSSLLPSPCDGFTTACTLIPIPYTESDAAHNVEMFFHAAHVAMSETLTEDIVLSVHGFPDSGVSVSNGTRSSPAPGSFQVSLVEELVRALPGEKITSCQDYPGAPYERRMCGDDNVQGRHVNGSPDACTQNPLSSSDRFVHIEQSRAIRQNQRHAVLQAFDLALPP